MNDDLFTWDTDPIAVPAIEPKAPHALCAQCSLCTMPLVPSQRPVGEPKLAIVGEAPGYHEARQGVPFVGPSGQLLDAVLEHIGIDRSDCFVTNAVLCQPPRNNLSTHTDAISCCAPRLKAELDALETDTIVALGATAVQSLDALSHNTSPLGIIHRRGTFVSYDTHRRYLATLHPAFVLRSPGYIAAFLQDMRSIVTEHEPKDWYAIQPVLLTERNLPNFIVWLGECIANNHPIAFDIETPNLIDTHLLELGMTDNEHEAWIITPEALTPTVKELINRAGDRGYWVAHNGKFDQRALLQHEHISITLTDDTMLQHYALNEIAGTHDLKQLLTGFLGAPDYEALLVDKYFKGTKRDSRDYSKIEKTDRHKYLAIDCCGTLMLHKLLNKLIDADNVRQAYQILIDASNALVHVENTGIKIDRAYLQQVDQALIDAIKQAKQAVTVDAATHVSQYLADVPSTTWSHIATIPWVKTVDQYRQVLYKCLDVNMNSWQQMQVLLYDVLGLKHTQKLSFKTDARSTNQEALDALEDHPFVTILRTFRRLAKIKGTYVDNLLALADDSDRVHINFKLHGTETGRLSAADGLHGIPRPSDIWGRAIRGAFIAQPGHKLIIADYSQAELRCFAANSGEPFLLEIFNNGRDPHGEVCKRLFAGDRIVDSAVFGGGSWYFLLSNDDLQTLNMTMQEVKDYWKEKRTTSKNVVFGGLVYMGNANGIVPMIKAQTGKDIDIKVVNRVLKSMLVQMPVARQWQIDQFKHMRDYGFVQSRFGNKRRCMLITDENYDDVKKASVNAPTQNEASQLTLLSAIALQHKGDHVVHLNHDQLMAEVPDVLADRAAAVTEQTMISIGVKYFPEVTWACDVEIADRWYTDRPTFED